MEVYPGIDVGSVTTRLDVLDRNDGLVTHAYMLTKGKPVTICTGGEALRPVGGKSRLPYISIEELDDNCR